MKIYLDVCCLNRPFDDQSQDIIHLEKEAIIGISEKCQKEEWLLVNSEVIEFEIRKMPDKLRKEKVVK